ncbi:MAG: type I restriction enzyme HsdR N-terminal domain-containing protein [Sphingobacterium composti]|uniref:type I restriction enzyme HsdR N-terminal domain-containing protein n=1 Tax=Sphingobacterium composti TaxID=363260 RepID=UPI00135B5C9D|nr:type I restriction enzyme HsdR N-terminal domain-containing protein [Sphingobacterium composti Ten et al. 2007 non Yoo et al. 2007]
MFSPVPLNLPPTSLKLSRANNKIYIFDVLRKKNLVLTPEEWVRQHWVHFLHKYKNYPKSLMKIEGGLVLNDLQKRSDLIIYNNKGEKIILAEFKAPEVKINAKTFEQISAYNSKHKIPLLLVSNGLEHYFCKINFEDNSYEFIADLPNYILET